MWCAWRTLLAAVALSCTLPNTRGHLTPRSDRIKDLVCVLVLSGMQREDLDVNMLTKLQRHNVNIDDMNNEELLRRCAKLSSDNESETSPTVRPSTRVTFTTGNLNSYTFSNNSHNKEPIELKKDIINEDVIHYIGVQPALQNVLKFWQDMKVNKTSVTQPQQPNIENNINHSHLRSEQNNIRNILNTTNSKETDALQKLFANYILRRSNQLTFTLTTTTETPYAENFNLKDIKFIPNSNYQNIKDYAQSIPISNKFQQLDRHPNNMLQVIDNTENAYKTELMEPKPQNVSSFNDMIPLFNAFKTYFPLITQSEKIVKRINGIDEADMRGLPITKMAIVTTEKNVEQKMTQDMIKEIAQSVKDLVLRELRKEIVETTTTTTTTTTTRKPTTSTTTATPSTVIASEMVKTTPTKEEIIMSKFLDLFNEIKSLKHQTLTVTENTESKIPKREKIAKKISNPQWPNGIISQMKANSVILSNFAMAPALNKNPSMDFEFLPQEHKFRSNGKPKSLKKMSVKQIRPITVQTNEMEIAPLGIPIEKPLNLINQNIIITTLMPHRMFPNMAQINRPKPEFSMDVKNYVSKPTHFISKPLVTQSKYSNTPENSDTQVMINGENHFKHKTNYNHKPIPYRIKPKVPRFHEELEKENFVKMPKYDFLDRNDCCNAKHTSKLMMDCCTQNISSRQQMSLSKVKQPSYDDTHFKNFLKSQQKVTDMLERILASRNRFPSVETA